MKKNILIPTDFSETSYDAIIYALKLYKDIPCRFYFLNVYNFPGYMSDSQFVTLPSEDVYKEYKNLSESQLQELVNALSHRFDNNLHEYIPISRYDSLFYAISELVSEIPVHLIIMGTKGETNSLDIIYGSNTIDVMENISNCPVLMIPKMQRHQYPKEIIFLTDYNGIDNYKKLNPLIDITNRHNAKICVLHINTETHLSKEQIAHKKQLEDYLSTTSYTTRSLAKNDVFNALDCFTQSRGSEMVCFFSARKSIFQNLFNKPLVKRIGHHSKIPALILH